MSIPITLLKLIPGFTRTVKVAYATVGYRLINLFHANLEERRGSGRRILIDVSTISNYDHRTGIQRVTHNLYRELTQAANSPAEIVPVYARLERKGYYLAAANTCLDGPPFKPLGESVAVKAGDIFLALDFAPLIVLSQLATLKAMKKRGVRLFFIVHDILPVLQPEWFLPGTGIVHGAWLREIRRLGEPICVSQAVRDEYSSWLAKQDRTGMAPRMHIVRHGVDPAQFTPGAAATSLPEMPYFLVVSTLEPRKGHAQTLAAFEILWRKGLNIGLVFAGRKGWKVDALCRKIAGHKELGKRLRWYDNAPDSMLGELYRNALCVLSPSLAEGFGLPLVEAAQFGRPLLIRDIPVYREIAGSHAQYFTGEQPHDLAQAVEDWLALHNSQRTITSQGLRCCPWRESCAHLLDILKEPV